MTDLTSLVARGRQSSEHSRRRLQEMVPLCSSHPPETPTNVGLLAGGRHGLWFPLPLRHLGCALGMATAPKDLREARLATARPDTSVNG